MLCCSRFVSVSYLYRRLNEKIASNEAEIAAITAGKEKVKERLDAGVVRMIETCAWTEKELCYCFDFLDLEMLVGLLYRTMVGLYRSNDVSTVSREGRPSRKLLPKS